MRQLLLGLLTGLVLGLILAGNVATAQAPVRLYGTNATTGAAEPIRVTSGALLVSPQ